MSSLELTYRGFISRISEAGKNDVLFRLLRSSLYALIVFISIAFILIVLESIFSFSSSIRMVMFFGFISALAATFIMVLLIAYQRQKHLAEPLKIKQYARQIGGYYPEIRDNLLNAVQLYDYTKKNDTIFSGSLAAESIRLVEENTRSFDFTKIISFRKNNRIIIFFTFAFLPAAGRFPLSLHQNHFLYFRIITRY